MNGLDDNRGRRERPQTNDQDVFPAAAGEGKRGLSRGGQIGLAIVIALILIGAVIGAGFLIDRVLFPVKGGASFNLEESPSYKEALDDIDRYFYRGFSRNKITSAAEKAVDDAKKKGVKSAESLETAGLRALVGALEDDHSQYLTEEENRRLNEDIKGSFFGVGFVLRMDEETKMPQVVSIIKGSPSDREGVKKGDIILTVDGRDTKGVNLDVVVTWIRGKKGTKVKMTMRRPETGKTLDFNITREKIDIPEIETEIIDGRIGYIHVFNFSKGIGDKVREAVKDMKGKGVQGFILDLRDDPGGLLDESVNVSSVFMNEGVVVSFKTKGQDKQDLTASGGAETDLPLVVMTNRGSASSSEIVAGALKDNGRATLVGSKSFGKGSVQKIYELENGGAVKLTISLYYLPNGESINGKGIEPDVVVEDKDMDKEAELQLEKAKEVINQLIEGKPASTILMQPAA